MAKNAIPHPYIPSSGMIVQTFSQLRKMFPAKVDAETLKKLSLAPGNEAMVINVLRYLKLIDDECKKTSLAGTVFSKHQDEAFAAELSKAVRAAYKDVFETMGDQAWESDRSSLIGFFRVHDETSDLTATRQSIAFETLASMSGHRESIQAKQPKTKPTAKMPQKKQAKPTAPKAEGSLSGEDGNTKVSPPVSMSGQGAVGLTVRIEINLPAQGDQETYDRIFQSIKQNLLNG